MSFRLADMKRTPRELPQTLGTLQMITVSGQPLAIRYAHGKRKLSPRLARHSSTTIGAKIKGPAAAYANHNPGALAEGDRKSKLRPQTSMRMRLTATRSNTPARSPSHS